MWQQNLMNNLLVLIILGSLIVIIYCKVAKKTLKDLILEVRGGMSNE